MTKITRILIKADNMDQVRDYIDKTSFGYVEVTVELDIRQPQPQQQKKTKEDKSNQISMEEILSESKAPKADKADKFENVSGNVMQDSKSGKYRPYIILNKINYYGGTFEDIKQAQARLMEMVHNPQRYVHESNERKIKRAANAVQKADKEAQRKKRDFDTLTKKYAK